jgi:hypothetical protein
MGRTRREQGGFHQIILIFTMSLPFQTMAEQQKNRLSFFRRAFGRACHVTNVE